MSAQEKPASRPEPTREPAPEVLAQVQVERPRCPYCHDPVAPGGDEARGCGGCLAWQHQACWEEHGACGACGRAAAGAAAVAAPATQPGQGLSPDSLQQVKTHLRVFSRLSLIYAAQIALFAWLQLWPVVALLLVVGVVSGAIFWRGAMRSLHGDHPGMDPTDVPAAQRLLTRLLAGGAVLSGLGAACVAGGLLPVAAPVPWALTLGVFAALSAWSSINLGRVTRRMLEDRAPK